MKEFSIKTLVFLNDKYYVYALIDGRNKEIFYIGKGKGNRVFAHEIESDSIYENEKILRIQEIKKDRAEVKHVILMHSLTENEAFAVEAGIINYFKIFAPNTLLNIQDGHYAHTPMYTEEFDKYYGAEEIQIDNITENIVVIKINNTYTFGQTPEELKDYVRGHWRINIKRAQKAKYIFALFCGWIVGIYEIRGWHPSTQNSDNFPQPENWGNPKLANRSYCDCETVAIDSEVSKKYLYKTINKYSKTTQNPITYIEKTIKNAYPYAKQLIYLEKYIPVLENIINDKDKQIWCKKYSVYSNNSIDKYELRTELSSLMHDAYSNQLVPSNYEQIYETIGCDDMYYSLPPKNVITNLTIDQIISCIAKEFRHDHFSEGVLINRYIADGILLKFMQELREKIIKE